MSSLRPRRSPLKWSSELASHSSPEEVSMSNRELNRFSALILSRIHYLYAAVLISVTLINVGAAQTQNQYSSQGQAPAVPALSELAQKNLAHVAAPAVQIEPVLRRDPGL